MDPPQIALHTPLPEDDVLLPPSRSLLDSGVSSPRDSYTPSQPGTPPHSSALLLVNRNSSAGTAHEQQPDVADEKEFPKNSPTHTTNRKAFLFFGGLIALVVLVLVVILPVFFLVIRRKQDNNAPLSESQSPTTPGSTSIPGQIPINSGGAIMGADGSLVTAADGSTFTYKNPFGGYWVADPHSPFNNAARAQSWVPALNETWRFGTDLIHG